MKAGVWKRQKSTEIADCRIFRVREDISVRESDNVEGSFFVIESPNWVNMIAQTEDGRFVLVEQYRQGCESIVLEVPGGLIDKNEAAGDAAKRELAEETGYTSDEWILLGQSRPNPAIQDNIMSHYLALNCKKTVATSFDEHEDIVVKLFSEEQIYKMTLDGTFPHSLSIAAFTFYNIHKQFDKNL